MAPNLVPIALNALRNGLDVCIVAHPAARAYEIADELVENARIEGVECVLSEQRNGPERYEPVPLVMIRPYFWQAEYTPSFRARPIVLFDASARFERQHCLPPAVRSVLV